VVIVEVAVVVDTLVAVTVSVVVETDVKAPTLLGFGYVIAKVRMPPATKPATSITAASRPSKTQHHTGISAESLYICDAAEAQ